MEQNSFALSYLLGAFLVVNLLHLYLIISQRDARKGAISYYALKSRQTYWLFLAGHIVGAWFFYRFAELFFLQTYGLKVAYWFAVIGVTAEIVQAIIPAQGFWEKYHRFVAYIVAWTTVGMGFVCSLGLPLDTSVRVAGYTLVAIVVLLMASANVFVKPKHFWILQMVAILVFYAQMFLMVYTAR